MSTLFSTGSISVLTSSSRARVVLTGELDASMNAELVDGLTHAEGLDVPIEIDARTVTFMDSSVIALVAHLARRSPHAVSIIEPPDVVRFLLDVTRVSEFVEIVDQTPPFPEGDRA